MTRIRRIRDRVPRQKNVVSGDTEPIAAQSYHVPQTPVLLQQFRIFYAQNKPVGVLWAQVNEEVETRLKEGTMKLRPQDWKSGDKLWIVEVIAPFGGPDEMVKDFKAKVSPNRDVHFVAISTDGRKEVRVV
jgi:cytolysin-activating lysine-acyltransferase